jgi:hypothetical protein
MYPPQHLFATKWWWLQHRLGWKWFNWLDYCASIACTI